MTASRGVSSTTRRSGAIAWGLGAAGAIAAIVWLARSHSGEPARCADGMVALGARCCGEGQRLEQGPLGDRCAGSPIRCGAPLVAGERGCVAPATIVPLEGGELRVGPGDWEAQGIVEPDTRAVAPFALDAFEVTEARWEACRNVGACPEIALRGEPGLPVSGVTLAEAEQFCTWSKGMVPTADQLAWAAAGARSRRYAWGDTGAVCRRAVWGLRDGPCGRGARGPDLAGSRPDGASPEGIHDLAGNVAEWARPTEPGAARAEVRGGSWADATAAQLRSWNRRELSTGDRSHEVGFRCAYAR